MPPTAHLWVGREAPIRAGETVTPAEMLGRAKGRGGQIGLILTAIAFVLGMVAGFVAVFLVIWPGSMKLTAPLLCDAGYDTAVVVSDSYSATPGSTSTTFTMYCMNDRGELQDAGALKPALVIAGFFTLLLLLLVSFFAARALVRARRRAATTPP
jgi:ABC-type phosphate transport system permease subunit